MSSRWPQEQQDQRSPHAMHDESWSREGEGVQPWQDSGWQNPGWEDPGWQDPDGQGYAEQWAPAQGFGQASGSGVAQAVAQPRARGRDDHVRQPVAQQRRDPAAEEYQREWERSAGGFGDDADYEWFDYLSGGRSAKAKPADVPAQRPSTAERRQPRQKPDRDENARRGAARPERGRSRRHAKPVPADPENGSPKRRDP